MSLNKPAIIGFAALMAFLFAIACGSNDGVSRLSTPGGSQTPGGESPNAPTPTSTATTITCPRMASCFPDPRWQVRDTTVEDQGVELRIVEIMVNPDSLHLFFTVRGPASAQDVRYRLTDPLVTDETGASHRITNVEMFGARDGVTFGAISVSPLTFTGRPDFHFSFNGVVESVGGVESWIPGNWRLIFMKRLTSYSDQGGRDVFGGADDPALHGGPSIYGMTAKLSWALGSASGDHETWYCAEVTDTVRQLTAGEFGEGSIVENETPLRSPEPGRQPTPTAITSFANVPCADPEPEPGPYPTPTAVPGLITTPQPLEVDMQAIPTPVVYPDNPGTVNCAPGASCPPPIFLGWKIPGRSAVDARLEFTVEGVSLADDRVDVLYSVRRTVPGPEGHREPVSFSVSTSRDIGLEVIGSQRIGSLGPATLGILSMEYERLTDETVFTLRIDEARETIGDVERLVDVDWEVDFLERVRNPRIDGTEGDFHPLQQIQVMMNPQEPYFGDRSDFYSGGSEDVFILGMIDPASQRRVNLYFLVDRVNGLRHISRDDFMRLTGPDCRLPDDPSVAWICD